MRAAQKLYEAGAISYMRTDSTNISKDAQAQILALINKKYGTQYAQAHVYATKSKNAQEAREAIRPTHINVEHIGFTDEQKSLYKLIWERVVSSQMSDAKILKTKIIANITGKNLPAQAGIEAKDVVLEHPADLKMGDYSTNVAMAYAKQLSINPKELAEKIKVELEKEKLKQDKEQQDKQMANDLTIARYRDKGTKNSPKKK